MMLQDPITEQVAELIGMSVAEATAKPRTAARRAAAVLRKNGFEHRYCHRAWEREMRWYAPGSDVPLSDLCATTTLGIALIEGKIQ